jgi:hypothetical protein
MKDPRKRVPGPTPPATGHRALSPPPEHTTKLRVATMNLPRGRELICSLVFPDATDLLCLSYPQWPDT